MVKSGNSYSLWLLIWDFPLRYIYFWVGWGCQINLWRFWTTFFISSFGPVSMSPQHSHSWWVEFQAHNRGHRDTRFYLSIVLYVLQYISCLQFLSVLSSWAPSSPPLSSSPSSAPPTPSYPLGKSPPDTTTSDKPRPPASALSSCRGP